MTCQRSQLVKLVQPSQSSKRMHLLPFHIASSIAILESPHIYFGYQIVLHINIKSLWVFTLTSLITLGLNWYKSWFILGFVLVLNSSINTTYHLDGAQWWAYLQDKKKSTTYWVLLYIYLRILYSYRLTTSCLQMTMKFHSLILKNTSGH